jgi:hypothetical protein
VLPAQAAPANPFTCSVPIGPGRYRASGAFDPTQPYKSFQAPTFGSKCEADWTRLNS